jgi:hypothetical protein
VDFVLVGTLGTQLQALQQQAAQLPLSEEDYLTLPARHADLVRRVTDACRELMKARDYAALGPLSAKLKELRALDLLDIVETSRYLKLRGAGDAECDGANDPVLPEGAVIESGSHDLDPVLPSARTVFFLAQCVGIEVENGADSVNDPVLPSSSDV